MMEKEGLSEKVSVNVNSSTLSMIDLLVDHGYYSNRSDFINQAVRNGLQDQRTTIDRIIVQEEKSMKDSSWFLGISGFTARDIEAMDAAGEQTDVRGYGVFVISPDADEAKVRRVIRSIQVRGRVRCTDALRKHYGL